MLIPKARKLVLGQLSTEGQIFEIEVKFPFSRRLNVCSWPLVQEPRRCFFVLCLGIGLDHSL